MKRGAPPKDIDAYLATVPHRARASLQRARRMIRAAAPQATETISYGVPAFYYYGPLVAFAAFQSHCSFFLMSGHLVAEYREELRQYSTSKGTIRFPQDEPLPAALVCKLVRARMRQNEERVRGREKTRHLRKAHQDRERTGRAPAGPQERRQHERMPRR